MSHDCHHALIVTIVRRGWSERVISASKQAGAEGGTVIFGRGTGIHEQKMLLGIPIEPEKEIVLTVVPESIAGEVLDAIIAAVDLEKPGHGICFVMELKRVEGIAHLTPQRKTATED
jgi:nitrogen regulatory protein PII